MEVSEFVVTANMLEEVKAWQSRPLGAVYPNPIVYLDCIVVKSKENKRIIKKISLSGTWRKSRRSPGNNSYLSIENQSPKINTPKVDNDNIEYISSLFTEAGYALTPVSVLH